MPARRGRSPAAAIWRRRRRLAGVLLVFAWVGSGLMGGMADSCRFYLSGLDRFPGRDLTIAEVSSIALLSMKSFVAHRRRRSPSPLRSAIVGAVGRAGRVGRRDRSAAARLREAQPGERSRAARARAWPASISLKVLAGRHRAGRGRLPDRRRAHRRRRAAGAPVAAGFVGCRRGTTSSGCCGRRSSRCWRWPAAITCSSAGG